MYFNYLCHPSDSMLYFTQIYFPPQKTGYNPVLSWAWPKQICLCCTFRKAVGISSAPEAMPTHKEQTKRQTLHWVLSQGALDTMDHACFGPVPGADIKQPTLACTTSLEKCQGSWRQSLLFTEM